ncbi:MULTISPECIES: accessory gene regulator ArgB-like protein [unclassified Peribacillus]|uniref:accessory gene regulator ArgB-like protein n=1 Tax=unclassified Peribacillus TaxID=2675266 RepID=UPI003671D098
MNWGPKDLSEVLTEKILTNDGSLKRKKGEIRYGLEMLIILIYQVVIILSLGFLLHMFYYTLLCLVSLSIFRMFSGGAHFSKFNHCLIASIFLIFAISFSSKYFPPITDIDYWHIFSYPLLIILIIRYAPILFKKENIFNKTQKKRNKFISISIALLLMIFSLFIPNTYSLVIGQVLIYQTFTITPFGISIIHLMDKKLLKRG